jgi:hypothetical protein
VPDEGVWMAQEDADSNNGTTKEKASTDTNERSLKGEFFDWLTNNLFFAVLPLFVSYLALSVSENPATVLERGDAFIITAALLAPEIAALRNLKPDKVTSNIKTLLNAMFLLVILSTVLFVTSTTDYNVDHPEMLTNGPSLSAAALSNELREVQARPPFPILTPKIVDIISAITLLITMLLIYYSIRERRHTVCDS